MSTPPTWTRPEPVRPGLPGDPGLAPDAPAVGDPLGTVLRPRPGDPYAAPHAPSVAPGPATPASRSGYLAGTYPAGGYLPLEEPAGFAIAPPSGSGFDPTHPFSPDLPGYGYPQQPAYSYPQQPAQGSLQDPAHGYGPPPAYGYPQPTAYGYPAPTGYGSVWGTDPPATDGLAIASLTTALAGLVIFMGLPGIVAVGLGVAALRKIARNGTKGRGLAIAGIAIGGLSTLFLALIVLAVLMEPATGY